MNRLSASRKAAIIGQETVARIDPHGHVNRLLGSRVRETQPASQATRGVDGRWSRSGPDHFCGVVAMVFSAACLRHLPACLQSTGGHIKAIYI